LSVLCNVIIWTEGAYHMITPYLYVSQLGEKLILGEKGLYYWIEEKHVTSVTKPSKLETWVTGKIIPLRTQ
jgi:hypothetical protein